MNMAGVLACVKFPFRPGTWWAAKKAGEMPRNVDPIRSRFLRSAFREGKDIKVGQIPILAVGENARPGASPGGSAMRSVVQTHEQLRLAVHRSYFFPVDRESTT